MTISNDYISEFKMNDIEVVNAVFHKDRGEKLSPCLKFSFHPEYNIKNNSVDVSLNGKVFDPQGNFNVEIEICASFECHFENIDPKDQDILIKKNTLSIMFPFLRSQFTLLTCAPNMQPIVLPPMNINAYLDKETQN